jgi:hypothetical protein
VARSWARNHSRRARYRAGQPRRNELEYLQDPADRASAAETADAIRAATALIEAASKILSNLGLF